MAPLPVCWQKFLPNAALEQVQVIEERLRPERQNFTVYPPENQVFRAFELTSPTKTKVVILGQDPYHGAGQANGLAFDVGPEQTLPPSLRNIKKEIENEFGVQITRPNLQAWATEGVLLLNTTLTVREAAPLSHKDLGWECFTDEVIKALGSGEQAPRVFLLWGGHARKKKTLIDARVHTVLETTHPSPLSAYRGFLGSGIFKQTNRHLADNPIPWSAI